MPDLTTNLFGLVMCGGMSSRMQRDKSMLIYHDKPQCYHVYEMLLPFCEQVFISCNDSQAGKIETGYSKMTDLEAYKNTGPMAALLTGFAKYSHKNFLIIGCDYPFFTRMDLDGFLNSFERIETAAAFYNAAAEMYEPLLAYYNHRSADMMFNMHAKDEHSLQHFLKNNNAFKFPPGNLKSIESIDTEAGYVEALKLIKQKLT